MKRYRLTLLAASLLGLAGTASSAEIEVMTQNQYLGADIAPLIGAIGTDGFNDAVVTALRQIADNRSQERFKALAALISKRQPHLVGLQEVWQFECIPAVPQLQGYPCNDPAIAGAFNDHLAGTLAALGPRYRNAGYVQNFAVQSFTLPDPIGVVPGIPFTFNGAPAFLKVQDRDVILARDDVPTTNVSVPCARPSEDGCNFTVDLPLGPLGSVERGFLAVDVTIDGVDYRFFNTHLEVQGNAVIPGAIQTAQAAQLIQTALGNTPPSRRLIIVGDMNSSPNDPAYGPSLPTPYMLFDAAGFYDAWNLRPGATAGMSCCQLEDLANKVSVLNQRIDLIYSREMPRRVQDVRVLGEVSADRTRPPGRGLWPSDHASVAARLLY
jgi:endonuclease/exonuclease/phosphatase family metal-dependent hydrolase